MQFSKLGQVFDAYSLVKKVPFGHPERVDFLAEQVTLKIHWPNRQASHLLTNSLTKATCFEVTVHCSPVAACPNDKLEFKLISSPVMTAKKPM